MIANGLFWNFGEGEPMMAQLIPVSLANTSIRGEVSGGKVPIGQRNRQNTRSPNIARAMKSQNPRLPHTASVTTRDQQRLSMITNTMPAKSQNSRSPNIARYCNYCYCYDQSATATTDASSCLSWSSCQYGYSSDARSSRQCHNCYCYNCNCC